MELGGELANYLDRRADVDPASIGEAERFEQYLLATYLRVGSIAQSNLAKRDDPTVVARLDESLAAIAMTDSSPS
jgi:hypothetical protein